MMPVSLDGVDNITLITNEIAEAVYEGTNSDNSKGVSTGWFKSPIIMRDPNGGLHGITLIVTDAEGEINFIYILITDTNRNLKLIPFNDANFKVHDIIKDWVEIESTYGAKATEWIRAYTNLQAAGEHIDSKYVKFLHRELWAFMETQYNAIGDDKHIYYAAVNALKYLFILVHHFVDEYDNKITIKNACFLCQYNMIMEEIHHYSESDNECPYCLGKWNYNEELVKKRDELLCPEFFTPIDCLGYDEVPPEIIRKLAWKDEEDKKC